MRRRVLILAPHFPPESGSAANLLHDLGTALAQHGDRVTVVTPMPEYHVVGKRCRYSGLRVPSGSTACMWCVSQRSR